MGNYREISKMEAESILNNTDRYVLYEEDLENYLIHDKRTKYTKEEIIQKVHEWSTIVLIEDKFMRCIQIYQEKQNNIFKIIHRGLMINILSPK